jgi:ectoine hydroxylase-related dioxygenase (phytanoyl-CoA dioxygenase family)
MTRALPYAISPDQVSDYDRNGAILLKGVFNADWIALLDEGVSRSRMEPTDRGHAWDRDDDKREMFYDTFAWRGVPEYRRFIEESPCAELAGQLMGADKVNFFFEAVFCRSPGCQFRTPWHQDEPYWSIDGFQTCTFWIPLVPVAAPSALAVVPGSHRWGKRFLQADFGQFNPDGHDKVPHSDFSKLADAVPMPDIDGEAETYRPTSFDMEPGDALVFNGRTIHGGSGQLADDRELRVFTAKWCGDDVRVAFKDWGMDPDYSAEMTAAGLKPGDVLSTDLYPELWRRPAA